MNNSISIYSSGFYLRETFESPLARVPEQVCFYLPVVLIPWKCPPLSHWSVISLICVLARSRSYSQSPLNLSTSGSNRCFRVVPPFPPSLIKCLLLMLSRGIGSQSSGAGAVWSIDWSALVPVHSYVTKMQKIHKVTGREGQREWELRQRKEGSEGENIKRHQRDGRRRMRPEDWEEEGERSVNCGWGGGSHETEDHPSGHGGNLDTCKWVS